MNKQKRNFKVIGVSFLLNKIEILFGSSLKKFELQGIISIYLNKWEKCKMIDVYIKGGKSMKTYRELYFKGKSRQLTDFVRDIRKFVVGNWKVEKQTERWKDYLFIDYVGEEVDKARVSIYIGDIAKVREINVGNIIPLEKSQLNVDEYNSILMKFYSDIIKPYQDAGTDLVISRPSNDIFEPLSVISKEALDKLEKFCRNANKSTGSSHPCDKERWLDFVCQTVDDGKMFDTTTLAIFLQDEDYWGEKPKDFIGVMGHYAWDEEKAYELALEYEILCEALQYYKETREII